MPPLTMVKRVVSRARRKPVIPDNMLLYALFEGSTSGIPLPEWAPQVGTGFGGGDTADYTVFSNHVAQDASSGYSTAWSLDAPSTADYQVFLVGNTQVAGDDNRFGVAARGNGEWWPARDAYTFDILGDGTWQLWRRLDIESSTMLADGAITGFSPGTRYRLMIHPQGTGATVTLEYELREFDTNTVRVDGTGASAYQDTDANRITVIGVPGFYMRDENVRATEMWVPGP